MKSVNTRYRARCTMTAGLVLLAALAVAILQVRPLSASMSTTAGQAVATPTAADVAEDAAHSTLPSDVHVGESDIDMDMNMDHTTHDDAHALPDPAASAADHTPHDDAHALPDPAARAVDGHADASEHEANADGHGVEAPPVAASTRGLVLGGFGAVNGLVILVAALFKTRSARTAKARRVNQSDTTPGGVSR